MLRRNPIDKQTAFFGVNPTATKVEEITTKATKKVANALKFAKLGLDPKATFQQIIDADPSIDKNYTKWLLALFGADPQTVLDDLYKATEYLALLYAEQQKQQMERWAAVSVTPKKFPKISSLFKYLVDKKVIIEELIGDDEYLKIVRTQIMEGNAALLHADQDLIICDAITEAGDCALGAKTQWCTTQGAFANYKAGGLCIMYIRDTKQRIQFTAQSDNPDSNGEFNEAKDESDSEISWSNYPASYLKAAKKCAKIVLKRIKATEFLTPITQFLQNPNDPVYDIIKEKYSNAKLLPIDFLEENIDRLARFFNNPDASKNQFKRDFDYLVTGISFDILMIECLVRRMKGITLRQLALDMKDIPGGKHKFQEIDVILDAFEMNAYETTNALWLYVMGTEATGTWSDYVSIYLPKVNVSWYDCIKFCNKMSEMFDLEPVYEIKGDDVNWIWDANGFRLPSEAEWEAAARARSNFTYAGSNNVDEVAWYSGNSDNRRHVVGGKKPNGYGLYDMSGNVSEWVYDSYSSDPKDKEEQPLRDPSLATKGNPRRKKKGKTVSNPSRKSRTLHYYGDPSHGWVKVPLKLLEYLGIHDQISHYSYYKGDHGYLEEDRDAQILLKALKDQGVEVKITPHHSNKSSRIRNYASFPSRRNPKSNPQLRKNYLLIFGEEGGEPIYRLNVTQGQYNFLTDFYSGQGSAMYSVLSRWKREDGRVDMTKELLEQLMFELATIHNRGGLNARQQKSLDALYDKAEKLLQ